MKNKSFWVGTKALFTIKSILRIFYFWSKDSIAMEILTLQRLRAKTKKKLNKSLQLHTSIHLFIFNLNNFSLFFIDSLFTFFASLAKRNFYFDVFIFTAF
jgi:hypothetical protein